MFKKIGLFILLFSYQFAIAQSNSQAEKVLTDLLNSAKTSAIKTSFKLLISEKNDTQPQSTSGTFTLKGTKFFLEMDAMKVWFDGKTQWSYVQQNNEVSITNQQKKSFLRLIQWLYYRDLRQNVSFGFLQNPNLNRIIVSK